MEQEKLENKLLKFLNTSVHHELLAPLKANIEILKRLKKGLKDLKPKRMANTVLTTTLMLMLHANDLIDQKIIENGAFVPKFTKGSVVNAIKEIISIFDLTLEHRDIQIKFKHKTILTLNFDKRRLQQVVYNLLSNAVKFSKNGTIKIKLKLVSKN